MTSRVSAHREYEKMFECLYFVIFDAYACMSVSLYVCVCVVSLQRQKFRIARHTSNHTTNKVRRNWSRTELCIHLQEVAIVFVDNGGINDKKIFLCFSPNSMLSSLKRCFFLFFALSSLFFFSLLIHSHIHLAWLMKMWIRINIYIKSLQLYHQQYHISGRMVKLWVNKQSRNPFQLNTYCCSIYESSFLLCRRSCCCCLLALRFGLVSDSIFAHFHFSDSI